MTANQMARGRRRSRIAAGSDRFEELYDLLARLAACPNLEAALGEVLDASLALVSADAGYIRLFERDVDDPALSRFPFVVHRGISSSYLDYFSSLSQPVDNRARQAVFEGRRVFIDDMTLHPSFEAHRAVVVAEGYKSLQAYPLMSQNGSHCVGDICTYFREVHRPSESELEVLDLYAELAASAIDQHQQIDGLARRDLALLAFSETVAELLEWAREKLEAVQKQAADRAPGEIGGLIQVMEERIAGAQAEMLAATNIADMPASSLEEAIGDRVHGLSSGEVTALLTVDDGSDRELAALLGISRFTFAKLVGEAMRKLEVSSPGEAAAIMRRRTNEEARAPFGELLRSFRLQAGLTQAELGQRARLSYRTISDLERGVRRKTYGSTVALLCSALDLGPDDAFLLASSVDRTRHPRSA